MKLESQKWIDTTQNLIDIAKTRPIPSLIVIGLFLAGVVLFIYGSVISPRKRKNESWAWEGARQMYQEISRLRDFLTGTIGVGGNADTIKRKIAQSFYSNLFWRKGKPYTPTTLVFQNIFGDCGYRHLDCEGSLDWVRDVFRLFLDCIEAETPKDEDYLRRFLARLEGLINRCPRSITLEAVDVWDIDLSDG